MSGFPAPGKPLVIDIIGDPDSAPEINFLCIAVTLGGLSWGNSVLTLVLARS